MSYQPSPLPVPSPADVFGLLVVAAVPVAILALIGGVGYGLGSVAVEKLAAKADELRVRASS